MNCPKCGTPNPNGIPFCNVCGTPLPAAAPQPQQYAQPQQPYGQPQQQPYGQPQYQQPYGAPQQYVRSQAPFPWFDTRLPLVKRINRSAIEALVAYLLIMFIPIVFSGDVHFGFNVFDMGALGANSGFKIGPGGFIAMWIIDIVVLLGGLFLAIYGIHLGVAICGGVLFITSLLTTIFAGVDAGESSSVSIGIGAIFNIFCALALITVGVLDFLKLKKKMTGR